MKNPMIKMVKVWYKRESEKIWLYKKKTLGGYHVTCIMIWSVCVVF